MQRESVLSSTVNVMKNENDEEDRKDDSSDPEDYRGCESSACPPTASFEPAKVVVIWIGKSVAGHKTSKKSLGTGYPCNHEKCRTPHKRDQGGVSPFKVAHTLLTYLARDFPHVNSPKLLIRLSGRTSTQETQLLSTRFHQFVSYLS